MTTGFSIGGFAVTAAAQCLLFCHYKPVRERYAFLVGLVLETPHRQFDDPAHAVWGMRHGAVMGDEGKAVGCVPPTALLFEQAQYKINKSKYAVSIIAVTPATESTKASLASW